MTTKSITVPNISCGHCTSTIERELLDLPGITSVKANVESKKVDITWDGNTIEWSGITELLTEIGFPAE
ncbi:MAG: heavy-metal-associated domain-containing protein [Methylococcales bacterium]|jgi:copper chaperone CopZ|nr:heavy-metal-associated domain-containing protein [Methylococcales bacterium]MBT7443290.1 heavy-metal-associated domain-containing protein [Methylococcales bacterium]